MITIRSSKNVSDPTLIAFKVNLMTPRGVYEFSSNGELVEPTSPLGGSLFGPIAWRLCRFRLAPDLVLEQQMFLTPHTSDVAISWELHGKLVPTRLIVTPYFCGCSPRSYRDIGFRYDGQENGGRLSWLPNVLGPKIIADTNGRYYDEPIRSSVELSNATADSDSTVVPGTFEFDLGAHPSILILSSDSGTKSPRSQHVGMFLAGLLRNAPHRSVVTTSEKAAAGTQDLVAAA
jgi:hypothetical protein